MEVYLNLNFCEFTSLILEILEVDNVDDTTTYEIEKEINRLQIIIKLFLKIV